ncbi:MAG: class E sortase [Gaiellales bacterium]
MLGALTLLWALVTWRVGDPFTALYQRYEQRTLRSDLARSTREFDAVRRRILATSQAEPEARTLAEARADLARLARAYHRSLREGDAVGKLTIPALGLHSVVVFGTSSAALRRGPGLDERTYVPGESELVYIAGHRTTYGAPFAHIDSLEPGDPVYFDLPYARLTYRITGRRIVDAHALGVLQSKGHEHLALQACHPRFFATHRYIADAKLVRFSLIENGRPQVYELRR